MLCLLGHSSYTLDAGVLWEGQYILPRKWCCTSHTVSSCSMHSITILGSTTPLWISLTSAFLEGMVQHNGRKAQVSLTSQTHSTSDGLLIPEPKVHTVVSISTWFHNDPTASSMSSADQKTRKRYHESSNPSREDIDIDFLYTRISTPPQRLQTQGQKHLPSIQSYPAEHSSCIDSVFLPLLCTM